jgi:oligoribonuclease
MSKVAMTNFAWIDLETTGLEKHGPDQIVELACIVTDENLEWKEEYYSLVQSSVDMEPKTAEFHKKVSGLYDSIVRGLGEDPRTTDTELYHMLSKYLNADKTIYLAGSGVGHFDIHFIRRQLPETYTLLHHAPIDIGDTRRFLTHIVGLNLPDPKVNLKHRAYTDIKDHIKEAKCYRDMIKAWQYNFLQLENQYNPQLLEKGMDWRAND